MIHHRQAIIQATIAQARLMILHRLGRLVTGVAVDLMAVAHQMVGKKIIKVFSKI